MHESEASKRRESSLASGWTIEPDEPIVPAEVDAAVSTPEAADMATDDALRSREHSPQVSNAALVLFGVFGGLYILYTWVWITWAQYYADVNSATAAGSGSIGGVLQQIVFWAVPFAPALWFLSALVLCRRRTSRLAIALLLGALVLVPVPMFISSGAAL